MKKIMFVIVMMISLPSFAQIRSIDLTASGLTCSMCSKAIYKSLVKLPFVSDVQVNIKNSGYLITFKPGQDISPAVIRKAVEDAGFFVAAMKITADIGRTLATDDTRITMQGSTYRFLRQAGQTLQGTTTFTVVDKSYLPVSEQKKYAKDIVTEHGAKTYNVVL